jgi:hypothetical protein
MVARQRVSLTRSYPVDCALALIARFQVAITQAPTELNYLICSDRQTVRGLCAAESRVGAARVRSG